MKQRELLPKKKQRKHSELRTPNSEARTFKNGIFPMWMEEVPDFLERHILNDVTHINKYKALLCLIYII